MRKNMNMCKSSTPSVWYNVLKPALMAYNLNNKVNKLLDYYEGNGDEIRRNQAYSKALHLQKKSNKLLGISQQCLSSRRKTGGKGRVLVFSPILFRYYTMDFKKYLENRLMMKELQLMRAEDNNSPQSIISALFYVVKELRFIYKQLFWEKK